MAALSGGPPPAESAHRRFAIRVEEDVGALRRTLVRAAADLPATVVADAALVATELGTNLVRHTGSGGYVLFRVGLAVIELLAVDRGPGIGSGSAAGSPRGLGVGLAGVRRRAETFDLYSERGGGTVVLARLGETAPPGACRWAGVNVARSDGEPSGDAWAVEGVSRVVALVVDGLGHGAEAAAAAWAAIVATRAAGGGDVEEIVARAHESMRGTRGGVLGCCAIDAGAGELRYAGVGNVTARLIASGRWETLVGREGTVGTQLAPPRVTVVVRRWEPGAAVILASDGLTGHWNPSAYAALLSHDPAVVAAVLHRDLGRPNDDAAVLVVQDMRGPNR